MTAKKWRELRVKNVVMILLFLKADVTYAYHAADRSADNTVINFHTDYILIIGVSNEKCMKIKTPCIQICKIVNRDAVDICAGCNRTLAQIKCWSTYTDAERDAIMQRNKSQKRCSE